MPAVSVNQCLHACVRACLFLMSNYPHGSASSLGDSRRSKINILNGEKI